MKQGAVTQNEPHQSPSVLFEHREQHKRQRRGFHRHSPLWLLRKKKVGIWVIRYNLSLVLLACRGLYAEALSLQCRIRVPRTEPQLRHTCSKRHTAIQDGGRRSQEPGRLWPSGTRAAPATRELAFHSPHPPPPPTLPPALRSL